MKTPSDKALKIIRKVNRYHGCRVECDVENIIATDIDAHTAEAVKEAVAPYQRVLGLTEEALRDLGACNDKACKEPNCNHTIAAIDELKGGHDAPKELFPGTREALDGLGKDGEV